MNYLTLGWNVDAEMHPCYWLRAGAKPGSQSQEDLFRVPTEDIACHTAIVAQSGSGKSFFLGRLIEEILLLTKSRCVILDPNADFRNIHDVSDESLWQNARYDQARHSGRLPHESSREEFLGPWSKISIRIRSGRDSGPSGDRLQLWWPTLPVDIFAHDLEPIQRNELFYCHSFARLLDNLLGYKSLDKRKSYDLIDELDRLFMLARALPREEYLRSLTQEFNLDEITRSRKEIDGDYIKFDRSSVLKPNLQGSIDRFLGLSVRLRDQVSPDVERYYLGKARELHFSGILDTTAKAPWERNSLNNRIEIIDLPSLKDNTKSVATGAILETEWNQARFLWDEALGEPPEDDERIPTFIIVDEAHNLIPAQPIDKAQEALREQFRRIVAEGRKYGLFLIFVSQRPDKLDPFIFSECENKAVMRIGSKSVLTITRKLMGLQDVSGELLQRCLQFRLGRSLMVGRWSGYNPQIMYSAPRRTIEGGRNLRTEHWASPKD